MTDHHAYTTVVFGITCLRIKERSLKDTCGKHDLVGHRIVVGVDRLRSHAPLCLVDRLTPLCKFLGLMPHADIVHVLIV